MLICIVHYAVKNILLSLSLFFALFGLRNGADLEQHEQVAHMLAAQDEQLRFDDGEHYHATGLLQAEEQLRVWQPRPSAPLKQASGFSAATNQALEFSLQLQAAHYLQRARQFIPGLTSCDIIFPFHYFW